MKQKQKKEIKKEKKLFKIQLTKLDLIILTTSALLIIIILGFYFKYLINKEIVGIRKELNQTLLQSGNNIETTAIIDNSATSPDLLAKLKESGIERYFLSKVEVMNNHYIPSVYLCLFKDGKPIYPNYIYETWSLLNYPDNLSPEIMLVRYILLPEDNANFNLDKSCFIKEIKTAKDWQEVENKYGFFHFKF